MKGMSHLLLFNVLPLHHSECLIIPSEAWKPLLLCSLAKLHISSAPSIPCTQLFLHIHSITARLL